VTGIRLAVFDLDGTLLRGRTLCEVIADGIGHHDRMRVLERAESRDEVVAAREEMAVWYRDAGFDTVRSLCFEADLAPGAVEACELLRGCGVDLAIASMTLSFGVEAIAELLGIERCLGTTVHVDGRIDHIFGEDKPAWIAQLGVPHDEIAAVGDSARDVAMLQSVGLPIFVGPVPIAGLPGNTVYLPDADLREVARVILS
jgi:HAD superfamily phosphoserine phosphatase-like hydrolase